MIAAYYGQGAFDFWWFFFAVFCCIFAGFWLVFLLACSFAWLFAWADDWAILALFFASKWRPDAVILSVRRAMQW